MGQLESRQILNGYICKRLYTPFQPKMSVQGACLGLACETMMVCLVCARTGVCSGVGILNVSMRMCYVPVPAPVPPSVTLGTLVIRPQPVTCPTSVTLPSPTLLPPPIPPPRQKTPPPVVSPQHLVD